MHLSNCSGCLDEMDVQEKYGLIIILSAPPSVIPVLNEPILDVISAQAGDRIVASGGQNGVWWWGNCNGKVS